MYYYRDTDSKHFSDPLYSNIFNLGCLITLGYQSKHSPISLGVNESVRETLKKSNILTFSQTFLNKKSYYFMKLKMFPSLFEITPIVILIKIQEHISTGISRKLRIKRFAKIIPNLSHSCPGYL